MSVAARRKSTLAWARTVDLNTVVQLLVSARSGRRYWRRKYAGLLTHLHAVAARRDELVADVERLERENQLLRLIVRDSDKSGDLHPDDQTIRPWVWDELSERLD